MAKLHICTNCGGLLQENQQFCVKCGAKAAHKPAQQYEQRSLDPQVQQPAQAPVARPEPSVQQYEQRPLNPQVQQPAQAPVARPEPSVQQYEQRPLNPQVQQPVQAPVVQPYVNYGPVSQAAPAVAYQPPVSPAVAEAPRKKSKTGLIIGLTLGLLVVIAAVVVFLMMPRLESVKLKTEEVELNVGDTKTLVYSVEQEEYEPKKVKWETSDPDVATVDDGKVKAVGAGTCTITVNVDGKKDECEVSVIGVEALELSSESLELHLDEFQTLTYTVSPANYKPRNISWKSGDERIATVADGMVHAVSPGKCIITLDVDGSQATCEVTVVGVEKLTLSSAKLDLVPEETTRLTYTLQPDGYSPDSVNWSTTDSKVAKVGSDGKVVAVGTGNCQIILEVDNMQAVCEVSVKVPEEISQLVGHWELHSTQQPVAGSELNDATELGWTLTLYADGTGMLYTPGASKNSYQITWTYDSHDSSDNSYEYNMYMDGADCYGWLYYEEDIFVLADETLIMYFIR